MTPSLREATDSRQDAHAADTTAKDTKGLLGVEQRQGPPGDARGSRASVTSLARLPVLCTTWLPCPRSRFSFFGDPRLHYSLESKPITHQRSRLLLIFAHTI